MFYGKLLVVEGICGSGKSTTANRIVSLLQEKGYKSVYNHGACTYSEEGQQFKKIIRGYPEFLSTNFYIADIVQDTIRTLKPYLEDGYIVVQDRYFDSINSYVSAIGKINGFEVNINPIIESFITLGLLIKPDLTIWCRANCDEILRRLSSSDDFEIQHQKYVQDPSLVSALEQEYALLFAQRDTVATFFTDVKSEDMLTEKILEFLK